ncbi:MAG: hypothetical protein ACKON9_26455 [Planctomycetaceae bacterium]
MFVEIGKVQFVGKSTYGDLVGVETKSGNHHRIAMQWEKSSYFAPLFNRQLVNSLECNPCCDECIRPLKHILLALVRTIGSHRGHLTTAVTGPPQKNYDFKSRVIGGSRSPLCSVDRAS